MWALRRAGNPLRVRAQQVVSARGCASLEVLLNADAKDVEEHHEVNCQKACCRRNPKLPAFLLSFSTSHFALSRSFSSQAGANSGNRDDALEDGFSDLEVPPEADTKDAGLTSEDSSDEDATDEVGLPDVDAAAKHEKEHMKRAFDSILLKTMMEAPRNEVTKALEKWANDGNTLDRGELFFVLLSLRKRKWFDKALQLLEWVEQSKLLEFGERDYASRLDLTAKVYGIQKAEQYIEKIPAPHRGEIVYRTLLANCVHEANVKKAEQVFNKMKDLGLPITVFSFNQLVLLYKRVDKKKIADVLAMMEKENVKPSLFSYKLLVDAKGAVRDIEGMEKVVEQMETEGIEPDLMFQATIARHYIFDGQREKAEALLESMEGDDINTNRVACKILLPLYAFLGKNHDVERIWNVCKDNPRLEECLSAIEAFDRLGNVEEAEKVFEDMFVKWKTLSSKYYNAMLRMYANHNLFDKGKELLKRMDENHVKFGNTTLDSLVKLYVEAGDVCKAESLLHKLSLKNRIRPQYTTYLMLLDSYSKKGDIHNSEKVFNRLRQIGYTGRIKQYQLLLQAYLNAKAPAYGFKERMKADNIFPNNVVATLIAATDPFVRKKSISDLLD
ncbi:pentatricopeptide repeat-containing protein [Panicum miliaceum]|uniref:Pentatricopeptide repeat-containing protein n=1 Tax=Panicum miliaceum TaxID=4540 RepID=A0A3L6SPS2_PANMI|nr:pentatricopeptide repeat-containing protein [Panicum miliaceum]